MVLSIVTGDDDDDYDNDIQQWIYQIGNWRTAWGEMEHQFRVDVG